MAAGIKDAVIFDFVGNFATLKVSTPEDRNVAAVHKEPEEILEEVEPFTPTQLRPGVLSDQEIIDCKVDNLAKVTSGVDRLIASQRLKDAEDRIIKDYFIRLGAIELHRKFFPHRSVDYIRKRAWELGISITLGVRRGSSWAETEDKFLIKYYKRNGPDWCAGQIHRKVDDIINRARTLHLDKA